MSNQWAKAHPDLNRIHQREYTARRRAKSLAILPDDLAQALKVAREARAWREKARLRTKKSVSRNPAIQEHLSAIAEAMVPIRRAVGFDLYGLLGELRSEVRSVSKRLQYEAHALRRMRA